MITKSNSNEREFISTDPVAVDANQKLMTPLAAEMKLYRVPIRTDIAASLTGDVDVYALSEVEAADKVQAHIDNGSLDEDIEMQDDEYGLTVSLSNLWFSDPLRVDENRIEMIDDDIAPEVVLHDDVKQLEARISWDVDMLAKHKVFLKSLMAAAEIGAAV